MMLGSSYGADVERQGSIIGSVEGEMEDKGAY